VSQRKVLLVRWAENMKTLRDLPDERRAAKIANARKSMYSSGTMLPESDKDVSEGRVTLCFQSRAVTTFVSTGVSNGLGGQSLLERAVTRIERTPYPMCVKHGAMNALNVPPTIWRCSECGVGGELVDA
jgi:hypothetical protein